MELQKRKATGQNTGRNNNAGRVMNAINRRSDEERPNGDFFRKLAKPRSKEYMQMIFTVQEKGRRVEEIKKELQKRGCNPEEIIHRIEQEMKASEAEQTESNRQDKIPVESVQGQSTQKNNAAMPEGLEEWQKGSVTTSAAEEEEWQKSGATTSATIGEEWQKGSVTTSATGEEEWQKTDSTTPAAAESWQTAVCQEESNAEETAALEKELEAIYEEMEKMKEEMLSSLPKGSPFLGLIYFTDHEDMLMEMGIIPGPGTPFSRERISEADIPEEEKRQWFNASMALDYYGEKNSERYIAVEVYLHAICVLCRNGSVVMQRYEDGE